MPSLAFEEIRELIREATFKRVAIMIGTVVGIISLFLLFDRTTGHFYLSGVERRVEVLRELHHLSDSGVDSNPELEPIYSELVSELTEYNYRSIFGLSVDTIGFSNAVVPFLKLLAGGSIWWITAVVGLWERRRGGDRWKSTVGVGMVFALFFGFPAAIMPTYAVWVYVAYAVVQLGLILAIAQILPKKREQSAEKSA